jgi:hypothetical protein
MKVALPRRDVQMLVKGKFSDVWSQGRIEVDWLGKPEDIARDFARKHAHPKQIARYTVKNDRPWG